VNTNDIKYIYLIIYFDLDCVDTGYWVNGHGHDCKSYSKRWCENGAAKKLGSKYNYPENNCCVCGKGKTQGNAMQFHYYNDQTVINEQ
jgi:hypothetical protein